MSHIDEGRLAAYLDGELPAGSGELVEIELHVAACADCRKLLDEALKHRNRARAILRSGTPSTTEVPAFDEILRRGGKNASGGGVAHQRSRLASLAWAATIVLAVGVGWYVARNRSPQSMAIARNETPVEHFAPPETTMAFADKAPEPQRSGDARREEQLRQREEQRSQPAEIAQAPVLTPPPGAVPPGARADELNRAAQPERANQAAGAVADERAKAVDSVPAVTGQALAAGAAKKPDDSDVSRLAKDSPADAVAGRALAERKRAETPPASVATRGAAAPSAAAAAPSPAANTRESTPGAAARWRETSQGTAMRQLGRLPLQAPDFPVLGYFVRPNGGTQVRVTYDLGGGQVLEVIQEKITGDSAAKLEAGFEAGFAGSEVTEEADGYRTTVRGPLSRDSLTTLLRRLR